VLGAFGLGFCATGGAERTGLELFALVKVVLLLGTSSNNRYSHHRKTRWSASQVIMLPPPRRSMTTPMLPMHAKSNGFLKVVEMVRFICMGIGYVQMNLELKFDTNLQ
jgi:hypothetical protein